MSTYFESLESAFLAHFCRRLSDLIIEQGTTILATYGITTPTTAVSSILFLEKRENVTVTDLAQALDVTHQMATQRVNTLEKMGLICRNTNSADKRAKTVQLTELGSKEAKKLRPLTNKITTLFSDLDKQVGCELMAKIRRAELLLIETPLVQRLQELDNND